MTCSDLLGRMAGRLEEMIHCLEALVCCESPSSEPERVWNCASQFAEIARELVGGAVSVEDPDAAVVRLGEGGAPIVLLGHIDTVHPADTLRVFPWERANGRLMGPGVFDMKAGLVIGLFALSALESLGEVQMLVTGDEEIGSPNGRKVVEEIGGDARAVLVLEPSSGGCLKTARKGVARYDLSFSGRAAHAGLEPELGANACEALGRAIVQASGLGDPTCGTTVTPTLAMAGTSGNTVPESASLTVDVRGVEMSELERVDAAIRTSDTGVAGVRKEIRGGINRPPLAREASSNLFAIAQRAGVSLGIGEVAEAHVGGGSDGNFTAAAGIPTLDGLGAVGGGAHTLGEYVTEVSLVERAALLVSIVETLAGQGLGA